jgi:hypothetical protein
MGQVRVMRRVTAGHKTTNTTTTAYSKRLNMDTRRLEPIQHTFEGYGRFVLEIYGKEAYIDWLARKSSLETKAWPSELLAKLLFLNETQTNP